MKRWIACCCALALCLCLAACHQDDGTGHIIILEGLAAPANVDPLLAASQSELTVVENLFEPLLRLEETGPVPAAAESWERSTDGLTYTFTLRPDLQWSDGKPVTAADFAFAIERAVSPETKAPCARLLSAVQGASERLSGSRAVPLGVAAPDARTLTVTLTRPDEGLPVALCGPAGMPCRQDFFESCAGRYGTGRDYVLANGPFTLRFWSEDVSDLYMRLNKNKAYHGAANVLPAAVRLVFNKPKEESLARLAEEETDACLLTADDLAALHQSDVQTLPYNSDCAALVFNTRPEALTAHAGLRLALLQAVEPAALVARLPAGCLPAEGIIVPGRWYGTARYATAAQPVAADLTAAHRRMDEAVEALGADKLNELQLCCRKGQVAKPVLDVLLQTWQKEFGLYVKTRELDPLQWAAALQNGDYDMLLCPMGNPTLDTLGVLQQFGAGKEAVFPYADETFNALLAKAAAGTPGDVTAQQQAEARLISQGVVLPLYVQQAAVAYGANVQGIGLNPYSQALRFDQTAKFS